MIYFKEHGLEVNIDKTKIVIFNRGGRPPKDQNFYYEDKKIDVVKEYIYLGVIFSNSSVFRNAAETFTNKGIAAINVTWNIVQKGKIESWSALNLLFSNIIQASCLYACPIWSLRYLDIVEKVQCNWLKRCLRLPKSTPNYLLRLETNSSSLKISILKRTIQFWRRLMLLPENRYAKLCLQALIERSERDTNVKFNWYLQLKELLINYNLTNLLAHPHPNNLLDVLKSELDLQINIDRNNDIERVNVSRNNSKYRFIIPTNGIADYLNLDIPLSHKRLIAQLRLSNGYFKYKFSTCTLNWTEECNICNLQEIENMFHFMCQCKQYKNSRPEMLNKLNNDVNFLSEIEVNNAENCKTIVMFILGAMRIRNFIIEE